jgi:hypothetical protein
MSFAIKGLCFHFKFKFKFKFIPFIQMSIIDILKAAGVIAVASVSQMSGIPESTANGKAAVVNVYSEFCGYSKMMAEKYAAFVPITACKTLTFTGPMRTSSMVSLKSWASRESRLLSVFACGKEVERVTGADEPRSFCFNDKTGQH